MKFKTNINCSGCIAKVTPFLDQEAGKGQWQVDTDHPQKILSVTAPTSSATSIVNTVKKAGFNIESLNE